MVEKDVYFEDYKMGYISIGDIPYKYWNDNIVSYAIKKEPFVYYSVLLDYTIKGETEYSVDKCFELIPSKYLSIRIYKRLLEYDFIKYNKVVPKGYIEEIKFSDDKLKYILDNFKYIAEVNRTPALYRQLSKYSFDEYLTYVVNYHDITDEYRNKENCLAMFYSNIDKYVKEIPDSYKSIELCEMLAKKNFKKYFKIIPEEFRTVWMYEELVSIDPPKYIDEVPIQKRNQKMYDMYFEYTLDDSFEKIPKKFRSKRMYQKLIRMNAMYRENYIRMMPKEYFDNSFIVELARMDKKYLRMIPTKLIKKELYLELIKSDINRFLSFVPDEYYTDEFVEEISKIILDMNDDKKINIDISIFDKVIEKHPELLSKFSNKTIKRIIEKDFYAIINNGSSISYIKEKYGINNKTIENILKMIKKDNFELYFIVNSMMNEEKQAYFDKINENIAIMNKIILSLGQVSRKNLTADCKLKIAYLTNKYLDFSLEELYYLNDSEYGINFSSIIDDFIKRVLDYGDYAIKHNILVKKYGIKYNNPWLSNFDINKYFDIRDGKPHSTYKFGNDEKELTLDIANSIIERLTLEEIPLNHLIVILAFRNYFNNKLDEYIKELHSYDLIFEKEKIKRRTK